MKHRNSHFAIGYWSRIRQGRSAPDQADIDPRALKRLLAIVFLLQAKGDGSFVYRLAGTSLCKRYGGELRGRDYLAQWDEHSRPSLQKALGQALARRTPVCLTSVGSTEDCRMVEIETVLMPITSGEREPTRFLGIAQVLTDIVSLAGRTISHERLVGASVVPEGGQVAADIEIPPAPPGPPTILRHPKAPHLRLVMSRDTGLHNDPLRFDANEAMGNVVGLCPAPATRRAD